MPLGVVWLAGSVAGCSHVEPDARPADCAGCHPDSSQVWTSSRHAVADDNPVYALSHAETARTHPDEAAWCTSCHRAGGVSCVDCHGPTPATCVDCHQMDLPSAFVDGRPVPSGTLGQSTVDEWTASAAGRAGRGCVDCHAPHAPAGGSDRDRVRETLDVHVVSEGTDLLATVTAFDLGHAFPTGDPFRRLSLTVCADLACARPVGRWVMERRLKRNDEGDWVVASDTRIPPPSEGTTGSASHRFEGVTARTWRLTYHLTDPGHAGELGDAARYVVATGRVEPR